MSAKDDSSQFQFLISCIKNSNAGKVSHHISLLISSSSRFQSF